MKNIIIYFIFTTYGIAFSQNWSESKWVLSDSLGIDWTLPITSNRFFFKTSFRGSEASALICNQQGDIKLYSNAWGVWNKNHTYMAGSISSGPPCQGIDYASLPLLLPSVSDTNIYYLFDLSWMRSLSGNGFAYWKIDVSANNGSGKWIQSFPIPHNTGFDWVPALSNIPSSASNEATTIKHGNGRDFWIIQKTAANSTTSPVYNAYNNGYLIYPFINDSLYFPSFQSFIPGITENVCANGRLVATEDGSMFANFHRLGYLELYDFDRCSGIISNRRIIDSRANAITTWNNLPFTSIAFSQDSRFLYASNLDTIWQYDLINPVLSAIQSSKQIVWYDTLHDDSLGVYSMSLAPNGKIYFSIATIANNYFDCPHTNGIVPDTKYTTWLGSIEHPEVQGVGCSVQTYGLYLQGGRSFAALPHRYNLNLGPLIGSPCDSFTAVEELQLRPKMNATLYPNPAQTEATLTWSGVPEGAFVLRDMLGRAMMEDKITASSGSIKLDLSVLPKGIYLWQVQSDGYSKNGKLVVE